jgi:hypothetical protein
MTGIKIDNHWFNVTHYSKYSEENFVKDVLPSVPDKYGSLEKKTDFLKICYKAIQATKPTPAAAAAKK